MSAAKKSVKKSGFGFAALVGLSGLVGIGQLIGQAVLRKKKKSHPLKKLKAKNSKTETKKRAKDALKQRRFKKKLPQTQTQKNAKIAASRGELLTSSHALPPALAHSALTTQTFIRATPELRRSLENFILDQRSHHTQRSYRADLKRFVKFLTARVFEKGAELIDRRVFVAYKESLILEKLNETTIDRHLASLKSLFSHLTEDDFFTRNPAETVKFLNPVRLSRTNAFTDEEVRRVLSSPDPHTRSGALHFAILNFLFYCGLRRGELVSLKLNQFFTERGHLVLRLIGKGNKERLVVITEPVEKALAHYLRMSKKEIGEDRVLFTPVKNNVSGTFDQPLDTASIYYLVKRHATAAGIAKKVSPHSCRATAISNARDHDVPDRAIQEFAGWSSTEMITRYDKRKTAVVDSAALAIHYNEDEEASS